jgi:hypothetical protein
LRLYELYLRHSMSGCARPSTRQTQSGHTPGPSPNIPNEGLSGVELKVQEAIIQHGYNYRKTASSQH